MNRPTREQVVEALNFVYASELRDASAEWWHLDHLAAEVVALREDNARLNRELEMHASRGLDRSYAYAIGQIESVLRVPGAPPLRETVEAVSKLRAKLARVEALPDRWRTDLRDDRGFTRVCADELEAALRGDP